MEKNVAGGFEEFSVVFGVYTAARGRSRVSFVSRNRGWRPIARVKAPEAPKINNSISYLRPGIQVAFGPI